MLAPAAEARIFAILTDLTAIPAAEIKPGDRLVEDLGMDSVSRMELISMLAEEFDMDIELEEAIAIDDVVGILALADARLSDA